MASVDRLVLIAACLAGVLVLCGCGLKGPLYLPDATATPAAGTATPTPAAPDAKRDAKPPH
jgi:predicted small lipoprotein YifL